MARYKVYVFVTPGKPVQYFTARVTVRKWFRWELVGESVSDTEYNVRCEAGRLIERYETPKPPYTYIVHSGDDI